MKVNRMRIITVKRCIQQEDNWPLLAGRNMFNTSELLFYISKKKLENVRQKKKCWCENFQETETQR